MMYISRLKDPNEAGGKVVDTKQNWFTVDGLPVATNGDNVSSHPPCPKPPIHCYGRCKTDNGLSWFTIDNIPVNVSSKPDNCGHTRNSNQTWFRVIE